MKELNGFARWDGYTGSFVNWQKVYDATLVELLPET